MRTLSSESSKTPLLTQHQIELIRSLVRSHSDARIVLFGSRATGSARKYSDVDICLVGDARIPLETLARINEGLEESNLPYVVEVSDFDRLSDHFRQAVERDGIDLG